MMAPFIPSSTKKEKKVKVGPPLTKLSGSAHDSFNKILFFDKHARLRMI